MVAPDHRQALAAAADQTYVWNATVTRIENRWYLV